MDSRRRQRSPSPGSSVVEVKVATTSPPRSTTSSSPHPGAPPLPAPEALPVYDASVPVSYRDSGAAAASRKQRGGWTTVLWHLLLALPPTLTSIPAASSARPAQAPSLLYYVDPWVAAFYDPYPKAGRHLLMMLRPLSGGELRSADAGARPVVPVALTDPLLDPTAAAASSAEWRKRLAHLHAVGRVIAARFESDLAAAAALKSTATANARRDPSAATQTPAPTLGASTAVVQCGYHALPSLQPLHMHVMTRDFAAATGGGPLKTAAQYATFQHPFFIPAAVVVAAQVRGVAITVARTRELAAMAGLGPDHKLVRAPSASSSSHSDAPPVAQQHPTPASCCCYCGCEVGPFRAVLAHLRACPRSPFIQG